MSNTIILGAGLAGLSASHHISHFNCELFEKNIFAGGHIHTEFLNGFTFDEGPHISFTKNEYVKELFAQNVDDQFLDYPVQATNYYKGSWIPHPAQSNFFALPEPMKSKCLESFLNSRELSVNQPIEVANYADWLYAAFGSVFADEFSRKYTKKYWTTEPENLSTRWVGERVFYPNIEEVKRGYLGPLTQQTNYISQIRYPKAKGYFSYAEKWATAANILFDHELKAISFQQKELLFTNGSVKKYNQLISTIPLPVLIKLSDAPVEVKEASARLICSSVLLVNLMANHNTQRKENWIYVYDENKFSTRINCTELLSPSNAPKNQTGIQVEVYFSAYKPLVNSIEDIKNAVVEELIEMGLLKDKRFLIDIQTKWVQWANVIFDHQREDNLNIVFNWLANYGLKREDDDLEPATNWEEKLKKTSYLKDAELILAGRFGQWKYYWTDDCVLRGLLISQNLS